MKSSIRCPFRFVSAFAQAQIRWFAPGMLGLLVCLGASETARAQIGNEASGAKGSAAAGSSSATSTVKAQSAATVEYDVALDGFCPVRILESKKWVRGDRKFSVLLDGKLYLFPGEDQKQKFLKYVVKYTPALSGDCIVTYVDGQARKRGSVDFTAIHDGRLFMFPSQDEKDQFMKNPEKYQDADLAFDGNCSVCRVELQEDVPGKPEFGMIFLGKRYLFRSQKEKIMFLKQPTKYAQ
jgi:YHS domain-containing protein